MTTLVERLIELREKAKVLNAKEFWLDNNRPWRIMATRDGSHYAVAEQHPESAPGDGEWRDGKTICDALNELLAVRGDLDTILSALQSSAGGIPEGYVMVPREPTRQMIDAGAASLEPIVKEWADTSNSTHDDVWGIYRAMIAASSKEERV